MGLSLYFQRFCFDNLFLNFTLPLSMAGQLLNVAC